MEKVIWRKGNNAGRGYAVGTINMTPEEAAESIGLVDVMRIDPEGNCAGFREDGTVTIICDSNGPWAVDVRPEDPKAFR